MANRNVVLATALAAALVGFMLNPNAPLGAAVFGPPAPLDPPPTGAQSAALVVVGVIEASAFGVGVALLALGLPAVRRAVRASSWAVPAWLAVSWLLVSWVPHTALHMTAGHDVGKLVAIEYAFHVTLVLSGLVLAGSFLAGARASAASGSRDALARSTAVESR